MTLAEGNLEEILFYQINSHFRWKWLIGFIVNKTQNI